MTTDIVERLRAFPSGDGEGGLFHDAAAEIARLRAALQEIEALEDRAISEAGKAMRAVTIARAALEPKP